MSMNRFVGLGIFALSSSVLLTMSACDDSATAPTQPLGYGGNQNTNNSQSQQNTDEDTDTDTDSEPSTTKASTTKASTTKTSTTKTSGAGGATAKTSTTKKTTAEGGAENTDTTDAEGGTSGGTDVASEVECIPGETDIMPIAAATDTGNWIGGIDDQDADNPCGIQGAFYAYSDTGADKESPSDDSLQEPAWLEGTTYDNPCKDGKCCIKGNTVLWPKAESGGTVDYTLNWGAGLGFSLGDGGESNPGKSAYSGTAKGFRFTLEGDLGGGQTVRIMYTQSETDENAPFVPYTSLGEKEVLFEDVSCPSWATDCTENGYGGPNPYDLQIQVAGGDDEGPFEVCLTNLVPL